VRSAKQIRMLNYAI